jgi:outer membrane protein, multidrug efflux system
MRAPTTAARGIALLAFAFPGCTVGPDYQRPELPVPDRYAGVGATTQPAARAVDVARWWTSFNDPTLDALIDRAVASNLDLRLATARLREARALRGVVGARMVSCPPASSQDRRRRPAALR